MFIFFIRNYITLRYHFRSERSFSFDILREDVLNPIKDLKDDLDIYEHSSPYIHPERKKEFQVCLNDCATTGISHND